MGLVADKSTGAAIPARPNRRKTWLTICLNAFIFVVMVSNFGEHHPWRSRWDRWDLALTGVAAGSSLILIAFELFPHSFTRVLGWLFISHKWFPVTDSAIEKRVNSRYYADMKDLEDTGFAPLFILGETMSPVSFLFVLPALTSIMMRLHGEVLTRIGGLTWIRATPVLTNKEHATYAEPIGLGVVFRTKLQDDTLIATDNFGFSYAEGKRLRFAHRGASVATTFRAHLEAVRSYEASGIRPCTEISSQEYIQLHS